MSDQAPQTAAAPPKHEGWDAYWATDARGSH